MEKNEIKNENTTQTIRDEKMKKNKIKGSRK